MMRFHKLIRYFTKNILIVLALVLIWRGIWYTLDLLDLVLLGENHVISALGGIVVGLMILYLPDKDLKEIEKL